MSVLDNNNRRVCLRLARRMIRASRVRSAFLCLSILVVTMLYTIVFYTADSVHSSYLLQDQTVFPGTRRSGSAATMRWRAVWSFTVWGLWGMSF